MIHSNTLIPIKTDDSIMYFDTIARPVSFMAIDTNRGI